MNKTTVTVCILCVLTIMTHIVINALNRAETLELILGNQLTANRILKSQVEELVYTVDLKESEIYNKGFEAGKTQLGIALMNGKAMIGYKEGYHAALDQFSGLDIPTPRFNGMPESFTRPPFPHPEDNKLTKGNGE